ncbi:MAG TPA: DUF6531 domain-containing protein, partial [Acidimicrobiales bacterium]|nr:DUF6531 domain-containing protein [Acidimicrobiales bacterium]
GSLISSSDGGNTWTDVANTGSLGATSISCPSASYCYVGGSGIYESTNSGSTWSAVSLPSDDQSASFADISCSGTSACVAIGESFNGQTYSMVLVGTANGAWSDEGVPQSLSDGATASQYNTLQAVSCASATSTCFVTVNPASGVSWAPTTIMTTNSGGTWTVVQPPNYSSSTDGDLMDVSCATAVFCLAGGWGGNNALNTGLILSTLGNIAPLGGLLQIGELIGSDNPAEGCMACELHSLGLNQLVSDPVNTATGDLSEHYTDMSIPTFGPGLSFTRSYDSSLAQTEASSSTPGPLGYGWTDNWGTSLSLNSPATGDVTVNQEDGSQAVFDVPSGGACPTGQVGSGASGTWCTPPRVLATLTYSSTTTHYTFVRSTDDLTFTFNSTGQLLSEADPAGNTLSVTLSSPSPGSGNCPSSAASCETITAADGRTLVLGWSASGDSGRTTSVTDGGGHRFTYTYCSSGPGCSAGDLVSVTDPIGRVTSFTYDSSNSNSALVHDLLTITDPNEQS